MSLLRLGLYDSALGYILVMASGVGVGPLLVTGYLSSIPREIDEAAAMDGAGYLRYLFTFLPKLMAPVLSTVFMLQATGVWNVIILTTILPRPVQVAGDPGPVRVQGDIHQPVEPPQCGHSDRGGTAARRVPVPPALPRRQRRRWRSERVTP